MKTELTGLQIWARVTQNKSYGKKKFIMIEKELICNSCIHHWNDCFYKNPKEVYDCDKYESYKS